MTEHTQTEPRWCYYVNPAQDSDEHGGFVPSKVTENEPGHQPLVGRGEGAAAWVWGKTLEEAEKVCDEQNAKRGLSPADMSRIVGSSMFPRPGVT